LLTKIEKYNAYSIISLSLFLIGFLFSSLIFMVFQSISNESLDIIIQKETLIFYIYAILYFIPPAVLGIVGLISGDRVQRTSMTRSFFWISYSFSMIIIIFLTVLSLDLYFLILSAIIVIGLLVIGISEADKISRAL